MEDPEDLAILDALKDLTSLNIDVRVAGRSGIKAAIEKHYGKIALMWAFAFYIPFLFTGVDFAIHELFKVLLTA